jgi:rare lipoprotein A
MKRASLLLVVLATLAVSELSAQAPAPAPATSAAPPPVAPAPAPAPTAAPATADAMEGLAAVYSDKLNGRKTASGQVFSQNKLTAAHPTLPFGTRVKVTNAKNGKSVEVDINDRGPKQAGRVLDMSRAAAAKIGIGPHAMMPVKLEVVAAASAPKGK